MLRAAIVEDEKEHQQKVRDFLARYEAEKGVPFSLTCYEDGLDLTEDFKGQFDVLFCDIQLRYMDGMKAAERIRALDENVIIIFITNLSEYAVRGYEVSALGYLLKPITYPLFARYLDRALGLLEQRKPSYLTLSDRNGIWRVPLGDVRCFLCDGHYIYIHLTDRTEKVYLTMKKLEAALQDSSFVKCNSGCIVNLKYVQELRGEAVVLSGGQILTVSRSQRKAFAARLAGYLGGLD